VSAIVLSFFSCVRMHNAATHSWLNCAGLNLHLAIQTQKAHVVVVKVLPPEADYFQSYTSAPMLYQQIHPACNIEIDVGPEHMMQAAGHLLHQLCGSKSAMTKC